MVIAYNAESVKTMDESIKQTIIDAGVPLSVYTKGYTELGPANRSALGRFANICTAISQHNLPIPPSAFIEYVVERTTGKSRQDFTGIIDGKKGKGKSSSSSYLLCRYAIETARKLGGDAKDYFTLDNCALLQDTDGITKILDEAEKYQGILVDDSAVALSSRDFSQEKNKNFNKIMTVCRTKRWFVLQNAPMSSHIDLQERELMDMAGHVYKSFHEAGFNVLKLNSTESTYRFGKKKVFERKFSFFDRKFDFYCAYLPDVLDPFKGFTEKYEKQRDEAANQLISDITTKEKERRNPVNNREKKFQDNVDKYGQKIKDMVEEGRPFREICRKTGLTDHMVNRIIPHMGLK
jgi:hypothetical protein